MVSVLSGYSRGAEGGQVLSPSHTTLGTLHPGISCQPHFYSGRKTLPHFAEETDDQRG